MLRRLSGADHEMKIIKPAFSLSEGWGASILLGYADQTRLCEAEIEATCKAKVLDGLDAFLALVIKG